MKKYNQLVRQKTVDFQTCFFHNTDFSYESFSWRCISRLELTLTSDTMCENGRFLAQISPLTLWTLYVCSFSMLHIENTDTLMCDSRQPSAAFASAVQPGSRLWMCWVALSVTVLTLSIHVQHIYQNKYIFNKTLPLAPDKNLICLSFYLTKYHLRKMNHMVMTWLQYQTSWTPSTV